MRVTSNHSQDRIEGERVGGAKLPGAGVQPQSLLVDRHRLSIHLALYCFGAKPESQGSFRVSGSGSKKLQRSGSGGALTAGIDAARQTASAETARAMNKCSASLCRDSKPFSTCNKR